MMGVFSDFVSVITVNSPFWRVVSAIVYGEFMLRMRRLSTMITMLLLVVVTYWMIPETSSGMTLISVKGARVIYDSQSLAFGSAMLATLFFGLAGFYLVRGRMAEDLRLRTGSILAATNMGNFTFLFARWLANLSYLSVLLFIFMLAMFVLHFLRSEHAFEPGVYISVYAFLLLPSLMFIASCAVFADAVPLLMGKAGDVLYFFLWCGLTGTAMSSVVESIPVFNALFLFDISGVAAPFVRMFQMFGSADISVGISDFDTALTPILMPESLMNGELALYRLGSALFAPIPLLLALPFFHRYSPDKVRVQNKRSWDLLALVNRLATPVRRLLTPLLSLAVRLPFPFNIVLADAALALLSQPFASLLLIIGFVAGVIVTPDLAAGLLLVMVAIWGILMANIPTREQDANTLSLQAGVAGGAVQNAMRALAAALLIIGVLSLPALIKLTLLSSIAVGAALSGIMFIAAAAIFLGSVTKTARTFVALFLFGLYISINATDVVALDFIGFNAIANWFSVSVYAGSAMLMVFITHLSAHWTARR